MDLVILEYYILSETWRKKGGIETEAATKKGPLYPKAVKTKLPMKGLAVAPTLIPICKRLWRSSIRLHVDERQNGKPNQDLNSSASSLDKSR